MSGLEYFYAYRVTDVTGTQVGKTNPGEHLLEREYKGNGSYTWVIYDFGQRGAPISATITGVYVGKVEGSGGKLTEESKAKLYGVAA
jgi:hypothetical protein